MTTERDDVTGRRLGGGGPAPTTSTSMPTTAAPGSVRASSPAASGAGVAGNVWAEPARPVGEPSVGDLVRAASEQVSTLVRGEIELAKSELAGTAKRAGIGGGLFAAAGTMVLISLPFLFVALAEGLVALGLPRWAAYLIIWAVFLLVAVVLALVGRALVRRLRPPERTLTTVKDTARWARHPTEQPAKSAEPGSAF